MFKPKYSITPNILSNLIKTAEARAVIDNAYLVPKWEVALRREALIKNAHASTAIEGNPLSLEQVSDLAMGRDIMASSKAKAEVVNYLKVLEELPGLAEDGKITEKKRIEGQISTINKKIKEQGEKEKGSRNKVKGWRRASLEAG
ncbi:MAG: hypothetical protein Q8N70_00170 [Deltaproteobacteria bacterium]|nr:hypothetical protein [Deltaproteobacteria bacterium]